MDFIKRKNCICMEDATGTVTAGVYFVLRGDGGAAEITSTRVDASLQGKGVAGQLLTALAEMLREEGLKAVPSCSYAVKWFSAHPEYGDVLLRE